MRLSLVVAGLSAIVTALPQRSGGVQGLSRGGRPTDQIQGGDSQEVDLPAFPVPQPGTTPDITQAGVGQGSTIDGDGNGKGRTRRPKNQGGLATQQPGNANQNSTVIGNNGPIQNGQNDGQLQNGGAQNGGTPNGQNQPGSVQNGNGQIGGDQGNTSPTPGGFDASLVPEFGVQAGQGPDGEGNCLGLNNVKIPCSCPPDRQDFIQRVQAAAAAGNSEGVPVNFPLDNSSASQKARIQTSIVVLQNLNGRGVGCPAAATTFLQQQAAA